MPINLSLRDSNFSLRLIYTLIPVICSGMMYSQLISLPYALTRKVVQTNNFGFFIGIVNISVTLSQLLSQCLTLILSGEYINKLWCNCEYFPAALSFFIATVAGLLLRKVDHADDSNAKPKEGTYLYELSTEIDYE